MTLTPSQLSRALFDLRNSCFTCGEDLYKFDGKYVAVIAKWLPDAAEIRLHQRDECLRPFVAMLAGEEE